MKRAPYKPDSVVRHIRKSSNPSTPFVRIGVIGKGQTQRRVVYGVVPAAPWMDRVNQADALGTPEDRKFLRKLRMKARGNRCGSCSFASWDRNSEQGQCLIHQTIDDRPLRIQQQSLACADYGPPIPAASLAVRHPTV